MTTIDREALADLLRRVEAATGPDRELDDAIWLAMCRQPSPDRPIPGRLDSCFTGSIDAALALVERLLPTAQWLVEKHGNGTFAAYIHDTRDGKIWNPLSAVGEPDDHYKPPTAPLAILAALLRALMGKEEG